MIIDVNYLDENFRSREFFIVAISSTKTVSVSSPGNSNFHIIENSGFLAISSKSVFRKTGLVHENANKITIFRGYDLDLQIHSHSGELDDLNSDEIANGSFAFIQYDKNNRTTTIKSDLLGISPIYYRQIDETIFISSHPNLLLTGSDLPDPISEISLLNNGFIFGDRTCFAEINRFPPSTTMMVKTARIETNKWYQYQSYPAGKKGIDHYAFAEVEESFAAAMEKCLKLSKERILLPLSSGYDSRRIFAYLAEHKVDFSTITSQALKRIKNRFYDIDGTFAPLVAKHFNIENKLISATAPNDLSNDFKQRDSSFGNETLMHAWSIPLINALDDEKPSVIFDGLAGDALGNTGFEFSGFHTNPENNINILFNATKHSFTSNNCINQGNTESEFQEAYWQALNSLPKTPNQCELAFLLLRTRRSISPWITFTQNKNHLILFPYLDNNHIFKTLTYRPGDKYKHFFQRKCLKDFYPKYFDFYGSRNMPSVLKPLALEQTTKILKAEREYLFRSDVSRTLSEKLTKTNKIIFKLSDHVSLLQKNRGWVFSAMAALISASQKSRVIIR